MHIKSKKGSLLSGIAVIIVIIMIVVFIYFVWTAIIQSAIEGESSYTSRDLATLIEASYAAPENVYVEYSVPIGVSGDTQDIPVIGTFAWDAGNHEICTSKYTEDEMWATIVNNAETAWAAGLFYQGASKIKKMNREYKLKRARFERNAILLDMNEGEYKQAIGKSFSANGLSNADLEPFERAMQQGDNIPRSWAHPFKSKKADNIRRVTAGLLTDADAPKTISRLLNDPVLGSRIMDPDFAIGVAKASHLPPHKASLKLQGMGLSYTEADEVLKSGILDSVSLSPGASDFLTNAKNYQKVGYRGTNSWDEIMNVMGSSETSAKASKALSGVQGAVESGDALKVLSTADGQKALEAMRGPKWYKKFSIPGTKGWTPGIGRAKRWTLSSRELRNVFKNQESAAQFRTFLDRYGTDVQKMAKMNSLEGWKVMTDPTGASLATYNFAHPNNKISAEALEAFKHNYPDLARDFYSAGGKVKGAFKTDDAIQAWKGLAELSESSSRFRRVCSRIYRIKTLITQTITQKIIAAIGRTKTGAKLLSWTHSLRTDVPVTLLDDNGKLFTMFKNKETGKITYKAIGGKFGKARAALGNGVRSGITTGTIVGPIEVCESTGGVWGAVCFVTARIIGAGYIITDLIFTTGPLLLMIHQGRSTAENIKNKEISCYKYIGERKAPYADPPNCEPSVEPINVLWEEFEKAPPYKLGSMVGGLFGQQDFGLYIPGFSEVVGKGFAALGWVFGGATFSLPDPTCDIANSKTILTGQTQSRIGAGKTCEDVGAQCPNYYISAKDWNQFPEPLHSGLDGALISGSALSLFGCNLLMNVKVRLGLACYLAYYGTILGIVQAEPENFASTMYGANILPREVNPGDLERKSYYYIEEPYTITLEKMYSYTTGEGDLSLRGDI